MNTWQESTESWSFNHKKTKTKHEHISWDVLQLTKNQHDADCVEICGTIHYDNDNVLCHQRQQSWHQDHSSFSITIWHSPSWKDCVMFFQSISSVTLHNKFSPIMLSNNCLPQWSYMTHSSIWWPVVNNVDLSRNAIQSRLWKAFVRKSMAWVPVMKAPPCTSMKIFFNVFAQFFNVR